MIKVVNIFVKCAWILTKNSFYAIKLLEYRPIVNVYGYVVNIVMDNFYIIFIFIKLWCHALFGSFELLFVKQRVRKTPAIIHLKMSYLKGLEFLLVMHSSNDYKNLVTKSQRFTMSSNRSWTERLILICNDMRY